MIHVNGIILLRISIIFLLQEKMKGKNKLVPRLLGINRESVVRVDEKTKEVSNLLLSHYVCCVGNRPTCPSHYCVLTQVVVIVSYPSSEPLGSCLNFNKRKVNIRLFIIQYT